MIERKLAIQILEHTVENAERKIAEFRTKLEENPAYALEWACSAFEAGADWEIFTRYLDALKYDEVDETDEEKVVRLHEHAERDMRGKLTPSHSSSFARNEMERERGRALRELVGVLEGGRF